MRKKEIWVFFLPWILAAMGFSQETAPKRKGWKGDVSLGISLARGNSDSTNISFSFTVKKKFTEKVAWESKGLYLLGRTAEAIESEIYDLKSALKWNRTQRLFIRFEIHGLRDRFKNYDHRIIPQLALGYSIAQSEKTELSVSMGLAATFTKYAETGRTDYYTGISAGNHFSWKISPTAELSQTLNVNADTARLSHYFAELDLSLTAAIAKGWAVKISLIDKYDNGAAGREIKKNDILFITNLSMKF